MYRIQRVIGLRPNLWQAARLRWIISWKLPFPLKWSPDLKNLRVSEDFFQEEGFDTCGYAAMAGGAPKKWAGQRGPVAIRVKRLRMSQGSTVRNTFRLSEKLSMAVGC